jgi:hypothetical protein
MTPPLRLVPALGPARAEEDVDELVIDAPDPHGLRVQRSDVLPRGWPCAYVWTCNCGVISDSILRDPRSAIDDHQSEHLNRLESEHKK